MRPHDRLPRKLAFSDIAPLALTRIPAPFQWPQLHVRRLETRGIVGLEVSQQNFQIWTHNPARPFAGQILK